MPFSLTILVLQVEWQNPIMSKQAPMINQKVLIEGLPFKEKVQVLVVMWII